MRHTQRVDEVEVVSVENTGPEDALDTEEFGESDEIQIYEHHRIRVDPKQEMMRVDLFLANRIRTISRSRIKNAAMAGFIRVNDQPAKVSYKVKPGDVVSIAMPYPQSPDLKPEPVPIEIAYEDDDLLVVNKQAGLVVHPGVGNYNGTLVNGLLQHFQTLKEKIAAKGLPGGDEMRPGLVHRIDKDTSGLLVVAKNELAYAFLAKQFFDHTTDRVYYAIVWGNLADDRGTITGNIMRSPSDRKRFVVSDDPKQGKHAVTHYRVLQRFGVCTLVECKLETGRTHQIRVHFKHIGHTLFSDKFYGGNRLLRGKPSKAFQRFMQECFDLLSRQALHAKTLGFHHPTLDRRIYLTSPLPDDMRKLLLRMSEFMNVPPMPELLEPPKVEVHIDKNR